VLEKKKEKEGGLKGVARRKGAGVVPGGNKTRRSFLMFFKHGPFPIDSRLNDFFDNFRGHGGNKDLPKNVDIISDQEKGNKEKK